MIKPLSSLLALVMLMSCTSATEQKRRINIAKAMKQEGDVYQIQGNYSAALVKLLAAEKIMPNDPYLQNSLGLAYMGKQRYDLAEIAFKKAISSQPDYIEAVNNLGAAYLRQKKWDIAIAEFEKVLESLTYPTPHFALTNIGWAHMGKKNYPMAQTFFLKALDKQPWFVTASHGLAQVFLQTGQTDRAMAFLHQCLGRSPDLAVLHADLAEAYEARGKQRQAVEAWQLVLQLVPENSALARKARKKLINFN